MHLLWKDFLIETNEKFCFKKDRFSTCFHHLFHDVMNNYEQNDMKKDEDLGLHFPLFLFV